MFANVFTKTLRDRATGTLIASLSVGVMLIYGMAVYRDIDISFYFEILPPALLEAMGIPQVGDAGSVGGLAFGAMYNLIGAFVLAGLAISLGASAVAGEEKQGTLGLLLGNPVSRHEVVTSKSLSMIVTTGLGTLILWLFAMVVPESLDVDMTGIHVGAMMLALFLNALLYGFLALAIGSWSGSRSAASGTAVTVMVVGYLGASVLPLVENLAGLAEVFPWYYFNGSQPVINGIHWGHTALLAGASALAFGLAYVGVGRRDLKQQSTERTVFDRLRANPRTQKVMERLVGSARVSSIAIKTTSEFQAVLIISAVVMFYMGLMMGPIYGVIPEGFIDFVSDFPDALIAAIGGVDMATAAGFMQAEIYAITAPIAVIIVTALVGARALAGEEESHTMDLLLGNPVTRRRVVVEKSLAMVAYSIAIGLATFLGTWVGVLIGGLELPTSNIAAASILLSLLGLVFGSVALAVGAGTGRSRLASWAAAGLALISYFMFAFFPLSESFARAAEFSPFHLYLGSDPLTNGMDWGDAGWLLGIFVVLVVISIPLFQRRDLRG